MAIFQVNLGQPVTRWFLPPLFPEENLRGFFQGQMLFLTPSQPCQSTDRNSKHRPNRWPGLVLSSTTTGLLKEEVLLSYPLTPVLIEQL